MVASVLRHLVIWLGVFDGFRCRDYCRHALAWRSLRQYTNPMVSARIALAAALLVTSVSPAWANNPQRSALRTALITSLTGPDADSDLSYLGRDTESWLEHLKGTTALDDVRRFVAANVLLTAAEQRTSADSGEPGRVSAAGLGDGAPLVAAACRLVKGLDAELPEIADMVFWLQARCAHAQANWRQAMLLWRRLIDEHPGSPDRADAWFGLGDAAYADFDLTTAHDAYYRALRRRSRGDRALRARFALGDIAERLGDYSGAAKIWSMFVYSRPRHLLSQAASGRLDALRRQGKAKAATPGQLLTQVDKLMAQHDFVGAKKSLSDLSRLQLDPGYSHEASQRHAALLVRDKDYGGALAAYAELAKTARTEGMRWKMERATRP